MSTETVDNEYGLTPPQLGSMAQQAEDIGKLGAALAEAIRNGQLQRLAGRLERLHVDAAYLSSYVGMRTCEAEHEELRDLDTAAVAALDNSQQGERD